MDEPEPNYSISNEPPYLFTSVDPQLSLHEFDWAIGNPLLAQAGYGEAGGTSNSHPLMDGSCASFPVVQRNEGETVTGVDGRGQSSLTMVECRNEEEASSRDKRKSRGKTRKATRPRYAFRTQSSDDVLDDGFRWRKYGQKAVKNSIYPRSYYRCAHLTCNVKKQVQRLSEDATTVLTTYEGMHNHPSEQLMERLAPLLRQIQFLSRF